MRDVSCHEPCSHVTLTEPGARTNGPRQHDSTEHNQEDTSMTWVKIDDGMPMHPKLVKAGPLGFALDVAGLCYSNRHGLDGMIPDYALDLLCPRMPDPETVAQTLVDVGRWSTVDGGWLIHDVHEYQPTREQQKQRERQAAEAGREGGKRRPGEGKGKGAAEPPQLELPDVPTAPGRKPVGKLSREELDEAAEALTHPHEPFWQQYPPRNGKKRDKTDSKRAWLRMTDQQRAQAMTGVANYRAAVDDPDVFEPIYDAKRWLRDGRYEDWQEAPATSDPKLREKRRLRSIGTGGVA